MGDLYGSMECSLCMHVLNVTYYCVHGLLL